VIAPPHPRLAHIDPAANRSIAVARLSIPVRFVERYGQDMVAPNGIHVDFAARHSLRDLRRVVGSTSSHVMTTSLTLPPGKHNDTTADELFREIDERALLTLVDGAAAHSPREAPRNGGRSCGVDRRLSERIDLRVRARRRSMAA
jgi:hypothetical protein